MKKLDIPKDVQKKIMHNCNNKMYEEGIIDKQLFKS